MSKRVIRDVAASNRARLLNLAREQDEEFQFLLERWVVERFLYRLSVSDYRERFVLKGAMLFLPWTGSLYRPTRDVDLLGWGEPETGEVVRVIGEICEAPVEDGLVFDLPGMTGRRIREDALYEGVRVKVPVSLDGARVQLQIDVGFGDAVEARRIEFPTLLDGDAPVLRAYPPEASIAEKFQAMVALGMANSRMKDFLDIWTLAHAREFRLVELSGAIQATFERRQTPVPREPPVALTADFLEDRSKQTQWRSFLRKLGKAESTSPPSSLAEAGVLLADFLMPAMTATSDTPEALWTPGGPWRPFTNA
jgi:hypothetical protein